MLSSIIKSASVSVAPIARLALGSVPKALCIRPFATVQDVEACSKAFNDIIESRNSCRKYKNKDVPDDLLNHILSQTLTAPTARNWQPFKIVILKDQKSRDRLSEAMPEKNGKVVRQAPGVAVFLADTDPIALKDEFASLWKKQGLDESKIPNILNGFKRVVGKGGLTGMLNRCALKNASNAKFAPEYYTNETWSIKQTVFPMELFVLSCQANGLSTIVMEGFDGRRIRDIVNCTKRYFVSGVVPFGYAEDELVKPTQRFEPDTMVYNETFGNKREGIPVFKRRGLIVFKQSYYLMKR